MLKERVILKPTVEFHAQNMCPMMCQICTCSKHYGMMHVVCIAAVPLCADEGRRLGSAHTHGCRKGPFLQVYKPAAMSR